MIQIRQDGQLFSADEDTFSQWLQERRIKDSAEVNTATGWRRVTDFPQCRPYLVPTTPTAMPNWSKIAGAGVALAGGAWLFSEILKGASDVGRTKRSLFLSFDYDDRAQVDGFRLLPYNKNVELSFRDGSLRHGIDSRDEEYVERRLREQMVGTSVCVCLIGENTHTKRWVDWEVQTCADDGKGILGIRLKGSTGRIPPVLRRLGAKTLDWNPHGFAAEIENAAQAAGR